MPKVLRSLHCAQQNTLLGKYIQNIGNQIQTHSRSNLATNQDWTTSIKAITIFIDQNHFDEKINFENGSLPMLIKHPGNQNSDRFDNSNRQHPAATSGRN